MRLVRAVALLLLLCRPALAQPAPEDVVRKFFKAEQDGHWRDAAMLLDLARFETFRRSVEMSLRTPDSVRVITADDLMKWEPDMPRAVAEYSARKMKEHRRDFDLLAQDFAHVASVGELTAMPSDEAAARWLEAKSPEWRISLMRREMSSRRSGPCPNLPDSTWESMALKGLVDRRARVLGATTSGSTSYVVVGDSIVTHPGNTPDSAHESVLPPVVMTLHRIAGAWKILPDINLPQYNGTLSGASFGFTCSVDSAKTSPAKR